MRISYPYYEDIEPFDIPDANLIGVYQPPCAEASSGPIIREAIENPIASAPIRELARDARRILIITDDNTRKTPVKDILEVLIPELGPGKEITILIALGTHRPMTDQEMQSKFGDLIGRFKIVNHEWRNEDALADFGTTDEGTQIRVNKAVLDHDLVIGIGQIVPHRIAGFSGGGKIIQPGICGGETTAQTHWRSALFPGSEVLGIADNPVRLEIERVAEKAGLRFIVNAVCNTDGGLIGLFAGHPVAAHRAGAELAKQVYGIHIPEPADILVIDSYPMDIELWQGAKALYAGELAVKKGGVAILISPCPEGVSRTHHLILEEGYRPARELMDRVESGRIKDKIVAAHLVRVGRVIRDNGIGILVSQGISQADTEKLGFRYAQTPQQALDMAFEIKGKDASVLVIRQGGTALPIVGGNNGS